MALKDFDFKQFMLQRGEWVGLGLTLVIVLPVFLFGMTKALTSGSPTSIAQDLKRLSEKADQKIKDSQPPADAAEKPKEFFTDITYNRVDPEPFATSTEWFVPSTFEDTRRRGPEVLTVADLQVDYVRAPVRGYILSSKTGNRVMALQQKQIIIRKDKKKNKYLKFPNLLGGAGGGGRGFAGGYGPGGPGIGEGSGAMMTPSGGPVSTFWLDVDKIGTSQNVRLAETIYPVRMAVVTGTFPYKQQLDEFRRALKKRNLNELVAMFDSNEASWQFLGFKIQRRVLYPDGREKTPWQDYDEKLTAEFAKLFAEAVDYEKVDPELNKYEGILNKGLVMVPPVLERGQYPKVEIQSIKDAIAELDKESQGDEIKRPPSDWVRKFNRKGFDIFDPFSPFQPAEEEDASQKVQEIPRQTAQSLDKKVEKKDPDAEPDPLVPSMALVRFIDVTVVPGFVYEYRFKVKMANPNYKQRNVAYTRLAEAKEIQAEDWTVVPKLVVPPDLYYYAIDEKPDRGTAMMQIHRWVSELFTNPQNQNSNMPVGDWTIAEKMPVRRGEYIGRPFETKVPLWNIEKEDFELAVNPKNKQDRKILVDFSARTANALDPALLVDYEGGKGTRLSVETRTPENKVKIATVMDDVPVQLLILTPEGKLVVRDYQEDKNDEERKAREKAWKDWIAEVESGRRKAGQPSDPLFEKFRGGGSGN